MARYVEQITNAAFLLSRRHNLLNQTVWDSPTRGCNNKIATLFFVVEKLLPFKSLFLLVNASFRRRHVFFIRLLLATAPIVSQPIAVRDHCREHGHVISIGVRANIHLGGQTEFCPNGEHNLFVTRPRQGEKNNNEPLFAVPISDGRGLYPMNVSFVTPPEMYLR